MRSPIRVLDDLSDREQELVDAARRGTVLVCSDHPVDALAVSEDPGLRIRAALLRELLVGRRDDLDPRGVRLHGARIVGALELDHVTAAAGLDLVGCVMDERVGPPGTS
jgi:hypothetical protein